jgi:hypothetical protein
VARHIKNLDKLPKFPPEMSDGVERIMQLLRPDNQHHDQCRRDVMDAIRMIADLPAYLPPSIVKKRLNDITANLRAARTAINELPFTLLHRRLSRLRRIRTLRPAGRTGGRQDRFLNELVRVSEASEEFARSAFSTTKRGSGGGRSERKAAMQKQVAAEQAFDLLTDWGHRKPSLTKDGEYLELAGMLFNIATGRKSAGEMGRACAQVIRNLRKETSAAKLAD